MAGGGVLGFRGLGDAERDAADGDENADAGPDREDDAVGVLAALPPAFCLEVFAERVADEGLVLVAVDVRLFGQWQTDEVGGGNGACRAIGFGQPDGFRDVGIEENGDFLRCDGGGCGR